MRDLEFFKEQCVKQAKEKGWNNTTEFLLFGKIEGIKSKLDEELEELKQAVIQKKSPEEIAEEGCDIMIVLLQILHNEASDQNLNFRMEKKIGENWITPKKTWDDSINKMVRK